jgi:hypothetical protein
MIIAKARSRGLHIRLLPPHLQVPHLVVADVREGREDDVEVDNKDDDVGEEVCERNSQAQVHRRPVLLQPVGY